MPNYTDIDFKFSMNPLTNDISILKDAESVKAAVRNIVMTNTGERPFNSALGSNIRSLLFEPLTPFTASAIQTKIENALSNFEPRVKILTINVSADLGSNAFKVTIAFRMIGDNRVVLVPITLKRLR